VSNWPFFRDIRNIRHFRNFHWNFEKVKQSLRLFVCKLACIFVWTWLSIRILYINHVIICTYDMVMRVHAFLIVHIPIRIPWCDIPYPRQKDFNSKKSFAGCIQFKNLYLLIVNVPIFGKCRIANRIANELENLI